MTSRRPGLVLVLAAASVAGGAAYAESGTEASLRQLAARSDGVLGACVGSGRSMDCVNGDRPMPMQSVMKLIVAIASLDAVDRGRWSLGEEVVLHREDISVFVQPIAEKIGPGGYRTTISDLITRAVIDSDSTATDFLIARLGGPAAVEAVLRRKGVEGVRIDRDERRLQTQILGMQWRPEFASAAVFRAAIGKVPASRRAAAFKAYQTDPRDTATARGMTGLLLRLAQGQLLSRASSDFLTAVMEQTRTFPGRLKAGTPPGWRIAHKTGTSGDWRGVTAVTNDVGVLRSPSGRTVAVSAFLANSSASDADRDRVLADVARIAAGP